MSAEGTKLYADGTTSISEIVLSSHVVQNRCSETQDFYSRGTDTGDFSVDLCYPSENECKAQKSKLQQ